MFVGVLLRCVCLDVFFLLASVCVVLKSVCVFCVWRIVWNCVLCCFCVSCM